MENRQITKRFKFYDQKQKSISNLGNINKLRNLELIFFQGNEFQSPSVIFMLNNFPDKCIITDAPKKGHFFWGGGGKFLFLSLRNDRIWFKMFWGRIWVWKILLVGVLADRPEFSAANSQTKFQNLRKF